MSLLHRIRRADQADRETEAATRITRNAPQATSRADIERIEEEMVPWLKRKRRARR